MRSKSICILYTGGTIGMKPAEKGYMPASGFLWKQMRLLHGPADENLPSYEFRELDTLLN